MLLTDPRRRGTAHHVGPLEEEPGSLRRQREQGRDVGRSLFLWFLWDGKAGSAGSGLASLNNLCGLWGVGSGLVFWPLALGTSGQGDTGSWSMAA